MNVMACHHWGKLVADIGVTFKEDLLVGPIEIAEFVAGDVDIQSSWRVIVVWTLKFCLCYSRPPMQIGWEYLYNTQMFPVSLATAEDYLRIIPSQSGLPDDFCSQGVIPTASVALLPTTHPPLKITVPAILEQGMRRKGDLDD